MTYRKLGAILTLSFAFTAIQVSASDSVEERLERQNRMHEQCAIALKKAIRRGAVPEEGADLILDLKNDADKELIDTRGMSETIIALYKMQEKDLAKNLYPFEPLEHFTQMDQDAFHAHYMEYLDSTVKDHERLLIFRRIASIYGKIAQVHILDGQLEQANYYNKMAARTLIEGLYDLCEPSYVCSTLMQARHYLRLDPKYAAVHKPFVTWACDSFLEGQPLFGTKIADMLTLTVAEPMGAKELFKLAYFSMLTKDLNQFKTYLSHGLTFVSTLDPLMDQNAWAFAEKVANMLAIDLLFIIQTNADIADDPSTPAPKWLIEYWGAVHKSKISRQLDMTKPLTTIFGVIPSEDLVDSLHIYKRIMALHFSNVEKFYLK
jgi:hypothetical protein